MRWLPHTDADLAAMLARVGIESLDALFDAIPGDCRPDGAPIVAKALTEWELDRHMDALAAATAIDPDYKIFLGAGSYHHHIPEIIHHLLRRGEFNTSYTPYQPEVSQGTLQAIYEYQTLVTRLLGMEVANASVYDGASALAEALLMAVRLTGRRHIAVSRAVHPYYRQVAATYLRPMACRITQLPYAPDGRTDLSALDRLDNLAAVAVQSPNFFGCLEDLGRAADTAHGDHQALLVACFSEPLAFGLFRSPGELGADIACGEGQSLGLPRSFGGPGLGLFAGRMKHVREMPGRIVGQTVDSRGARGFVLTLATREQHIRRERATSNICTNQGLCAMAAAMYMACLGGSGFRRLARLNHDKAGYLKNSLSQAGVSVPFGAATFNEFVIRLPEGSRHRYHQLAEPKNHRRPAPRTTLSGTQGPLSALRHRNQQQSGY